MHCPHTNRPAVMDDCHSIICGAKDSGIIALCRACVFGQRIMANCVLPVSVAEPEEIPQETPKEVPTMKTITAKELFDLLAVPNGSRTKIITLMRQGQLPNGPNGRAIAECLENLGINISHVVIPEVNFREALPAPAPKAAPEESRYREAPPVSLKEALSIPKEQSKVRELKAPKENQPPLLEHYLMEELCGEVAKRLAPGVTVQITGR